ncbi:unnamed protein product [Cochlearia groenlandica]
MGMKILMTMEEPTYKELTLQFLATVKYGDQESRRKVNFKLGGISYSIQFISHVCQASELLKHLIAIREEEEEIGHDHVVAIGGMLTPLFRSLRIDLQEFKELPTAYMDEE